MTLEQYLGLVPPWHAERPRYINMLAVLIQALIDAQAMLAKLTADFDLDTAVGVQLDMVGQWLGRTRYLDEPLTGVYFAFHAPADPVVRDGFNQGIWMGKYDPTTAIVAMDDETFRSILKLQAIANQWDGTLPSIQAAFDRVYPGVVVQDKGDVAGGLMSMDVLIPGIQLSTLLLGALQQDFPIKPSGVRTSIIESTVTQTPLFGFNINDAIIAGFNTGSWGVVIQET